MRIRTAAFLLTVVALAAGNRTLAQRSGGRPTASTIDVTLRTVTPVVSRLEELLLSVSVANKSKSAIELLFDEPCRRNYGPWSTLTVVRNSRGDTVVRHMTKNVIERKEYTESELAGYKLLLQPKDWRMRIYALSDLAILDDRKYDKDGFLPAGRYTVQVFVYGVPSEVALVTLRPAPAPPSPAHKKPQRF